MGMAWDFGHSLVTLILFLFSSFLHQLFTTPDSVEKGWASNAQCAQTWKKTYQAAAKWSRNATTELGEGGGGGDDATLRVRRSFSEPLLHPTRDRPVHTSLSCVSAQVARSRLRIFFPFLPFWTHCATILNKVTFSWIAWNVFKYWSFQCSVSLGEVLCILIDAHNNSFGEKYL